MQEALTFSTGQTSKPPSECQSAILSVARATILDLTSGSILGHGACTKAVDVQNQWMYIIMDGTKACQNVHTQAGKSEEWETCDKKAKAFYHNQRIAANA